MTHHDKARELVEKLREDHNSIWQFLMDDAADLITAQIEENRRLREAIRHADDILEDRGFAIEIGARRVLRIALSSTGEKG
ncbi:hypothetical protein [Paracoccus denitrificans]|jgi:uncharacterized membrane-anchored protein YhcB (DUF1043 family)|uniref:Uncharacterized protein n=1 Tax=Paracoccus denitrificans (strain Pd 1222) TaxID=318586 RepID=A1B8F5_PARDP|nr:hypothetical protein [Paracoccus denitrificans]ABL71799.1 hypothetical protein Pden_3732 [Paracoccus denitrificans PD1222]MBB4628104.1 uncharacterized membrane-anchored protein YhcB (DUF1043 family) [Paracoccus denitrificans]MCU7429169.1 hypothetical protein [Paracoccus denitrificans]QAR28383.1 hypothetical protein EO213_18950 [Paracoccus denitrificans]UPV96519.1 hypothetical protein M0K93_19040 [Paracoccus denitrificans]